MGDWNKFWELVDRKVPGDAVRAGNSDIGIYGDYLEGQFVKEQLNQVCRECGLEWHIDWDTVRMNTMQEPFRYFVTYMTGDLVISDDVPISGEYKEIRRPGMGVGRCICPFDRDKQEVLQTPADHQIDTVMKTALTDFIKNAAMRLGRYFGGELYFDERMAGVLGWEIASDRAARRRTGDATPSDLGSYTIHPDGWGKENKFGGMSLQELYEDPDGYGAMSWAATLDAPRGATAKMAQYFNFRQQQEAEAKGIVEVPDGMSLEEYDKSGASRAAVPASRPADGPVVKIAGRNLLANELLTPAWTNYVQQQLVEHTGPEELFGHHNHVINHLKSHFSVAKVMDLTGEKAAALVRYIESGGKDKDPRWYDDVEELFGEEELEDLMKKAAPHLPTGFQDMPLVYFNRKYGEFGIRIPLNAKQEKGIRTLLQAIISGSIDLEDTESATYQLFKLGMEDVAQDADVIISRVS